MGSKAAGADAVADVVAANCTPTDGTMGEDVVLVGFLERRTGLGLPLKKERRGDWLSAHFALGKLKTWMKEWSKIFHDRENGP